MPNGRKKDLVAQLVEHLPFKERVLGSSPSQITKKVLIFLLEHHFSPDLPENDLLIITGPGAGIGRQAWLRAMCPLGRAGSSPALGTFSLPVIFSILFLIFC